MQLKWIFEAEWIWVSTNMLHWGQHMGKSRRRWHEFPLWGCASGTFSWSKIAHQFLGIEMYFYFLKIGTHTHSNWELMFKPLQVLYLSKLSAISKPTTSLPQQLASFHPILLYVYFREKKSHQFQVTQDGFSLVAIFRNLKQTHFGWWFPPTFRSPEAVPFLCGRLLCNGSPSLRAATELGRWQSDFYHWCFDETSALGQKKCQEIWVLEVMRRDEKSFLLHLSHREKGGNHSEMWWIRMKHAWNIMKDSSDSRQIERFSIMASDNLSETETR